MIKSELTILLIALSTFLVSGCSEDDTSSSFKEETKEEVLKHNIQEAKSIFYMLPSPIETASILQKAGAEYDATILNPIENVSKYELASVKAINLGIYGSDLSYASVFEQTQEVMFYMTSCKKLADGLGLTNAFDSETMERMEENINDKDSLLRLISDAYWMADTYLEENERSNLSALIISGGWIEGLYIATQLARSNPTKELIARIAEQKLSLEHLIEIIKTYKDDHGDVNDVFKDLEEVKLLFDKIEHQQDNVTTSVNERGITTIGGSSSLNLHEDLLKEITNKVETIRNRYIQ